MTKQRAAKAHPRADDEHQELREAVAWLNGQKRVLGDALVFAIDNEGYLHATLFGQPLA